MTEATTNYVTVRHENVLIPGGIHRLSKIADLTIYPHLIPADVKRVRGSVQVYTISPGSSTRREPALQIPFRATILHGSLDYDKETTYFYIGPSSTKSIDEKKQECRSIKFMNRFDESMVIFNVTTDKVDLLSQFVKVKMIVPHRSSIRVHVTFQIKSLSTHVYVSPGRPSTPVCITVLKRSSSSAPFSNFEASMTLHTNLSFFHLPIYLYNGLLSVRRKTLAPLLCLDPLYRLDPSDY